MTAVTILFLVISVLSVTVTFGETLNLTLLHVNDIHVRMEETNKYSSNCKAKDKAAGNCYGGIARLSAAVNDIKHKDDHVIWLNAGDFYQGTVWYTQFKWKAVSVFNNLLNFDAMTLGNHEFDDKIEGLIPFLQNQTNPVVVTNLNTSQVPELEDFILPSKVLHVSGVPVGLVGYLTPDTKQISNPGDKLIFNDEIDSLRPEVDKLKEDGVKIIIAIGHSGYQRDLEIARAIPEIDVIVGGHSHSFLYTETEDKQNPSINPIRGPYPTMVEHPDTNSKTLVLQAYAYTKYLGHIKLSFDNYGNLQGWEGEPILLDNSYKKDPMIEAELKPWREELDTLNSQIIGSAGEVMFNSRGKESNLGNFVTDAMVESWKDQTMPDGSLIRLAITNSGSIRSTFDKGNITLEDLLTAFPFQNTFDVMTITGATLRHALEHSVAKMTKQGKNASGRFLQVSGFKLKFDLREEPGSRLKSSLVLCNNCDGDEYKELDDKSMYNVIVINYVAGGGDGYTMFQNRTNYIIGSLDAGILKEQIEKKSPIRQEIEGRILFIDQEQQSVDTSLAETINNKLWTSVFCIIINFMYLNCLK